MLSEKTEGIRIARWADRFFAWIIDIAIVIIVMGIIGGMLAGNIAGDEITSDDITWEYLIGNVIFFAYWVVFEYIWGQSIGKRILNLRVISTDGHMPGLKEIMTSSFGKAFLLPIDIILGLIFTNKDRQRAFNKLSNTIVIKIQNGVKVPYSMD